MKKLQRLKAQIAKTEAMWHAWGQACRTCDNIDDNCARKIRDRLFKVFIKSLDKTYEMAAKVGASSPQKGASAPSFDAARTQ